MVQKVACIVQADVFNVFLHAEVDVDVYMHHSPGFPGPPGTICKIKKGFVWYVSGISSLARKDTQNFYFYRICML